MQDFLKDKKFEAVKYRHEDQAKLLHFITTLDNQLYGGFLTIQLAFGGFLTQFEIENYASKIGLFIIDLTIAFVCSMLLYNNYRRRKEVVETIKNCNTALSFNEVNIFIPDKSINAVYAYRPWFYWFLVGLIATVIGISLILFIPTKKIKKESNTSININFSINKDTVQIKRDTTFILNK